MTDIAKQILTSIPNLVLVLDDSQNIIFANTAFGIFNGQRAADFIGQSFTMVLQTTEEQKEQLVNEILTCHQGKEPQPAQTPRNKVAHGSESRDPLNSKVSQSSGFNPPSVVSLKDRIFAYEVFRFQESPGGLARTGIVFNDLTEEKEFLDRMTQAENISNLKTLVAGISHEISNPLHSILTFSEAILETQEAEKVRTYAEKVADNSRRLGQVISRFSEYVQSKNNGAKQRINLNESVKEALEFALLPYQENQIELETSYSDLQEITGDPEEVQQIFVNILNNAIQAMKLKGKLMISTREEDDFLVIRIEDNGPGMPREILRKVFNPFFTTKKQGEGTGLGLSITQKLLEKYKGNMEIQSKEGQGTQVSIFFAKTAPQG